jgi:hypothetical protein
MADPAGDYLGPEAQARVDIDRQLTACGWVVQRYRKVNLGTGPGVAVREFPMAEGHGDADYLLFVDRKAVGVGRLGVEPVREPRLHAGRLVGEGEGLGERRDAVGQAGGVLGRLPFDAGEGGALLLGLEDPASALSRAGSCRTTLTTNRRLSS